MYLVNVWNKNKNKNELIVPCHALFSLEKDVWRLNGLTFDRNGGTTQEKGGDPIFL
jgi:thymidylate synthase